MSNQNTNQNEVAEKLANRIEILRKAKQWIFSNYLTYRKGDDKYDKFETLVNSISSLLNEDYSSILNKKEIYETDVMHLINKLEWKLNKMVPEDTEEDESFEDDNAFHGQELQTEYKDVSKLITTDNLSEQLDSINTSLSYEDKIHYYSNDTKHFVSVYDGLIDSVAYQSLNPSAILVLIDVMRVIGLSIGNESKKDAFVYGFPFSYAFCRQPISETTFYECLDDLKGKGFIKPLPRKNGQVQKFLPSQEWINYRDNGEVEKIKETKEIRKRRDNFRNPFKK